jgi:hypothetical protein
MRNECQREIKIQILKKKMCVVSLKIEMNSVPKTDNNGNKINP